MNGINYSTNNKEEKIENIVTSLLNHMINKILSMCKEHLAKPNRERVRRCRQRKQEAHTSEYMHRIQQQKRQYREVRRLNHVNN